jgi:hypothetical protein
MSDLGPRIRRLVDETAPPIDGLSIVQRSDRRTTRPRWAVGVASGLAVLVVGLLTYAVLGWEPNREPAVEPGPDTTSLSETTIGAIPSTTSAADREAATRAQEEARRRAAKEAARQAAAQQTVYFGISLPGWEFSGAGEALGGCQNQPDPLLGARQATYVAPETPGRSVNLNVISRWALCPSDEIATSANDLGPPAMPPDVIDHGTTTVMGHEARIVEEHGVYEVLWLLDEYGSYAGIVVFPGVTPLTVDEVLAIAQGVVELTSDQWEALVAATPSSGTTTVP